MHVSSRELDPQLHTHCVVINASQKDDGKWRAFDYSEIFNNKKDLGMMYRNELAIELQKMGFKIEFVKPDLFEIAGFDKAVLEEFSIRSKQIDARFQELKALHPNTNDAVLKNQATLETRKVKDEPKLEVLKEQWAERLNNLGINQQNIIKHDDTLPEQLNLSVNDAVNKSMQILTETEAVINQEKIIAMTNKLNFAKFSTSEIIENLQSNPNLVNLGSNKYTTKEIKHTERAILNFVENTQNTQAKIISEPEKLRTGIEAYELSQGFSLTCDQRNAVKHILDTKDKVIAIQGDAGTGKTTMLDTVRTICDKECQDVEIVGLSFTGKAAHEIQEASNIQSSTIASFLNSKSEIDPNQKRLYVIDEASMLSIQDMKRVLQKCESENAKIVLIGDTKQLQAIGAGKIFQSLQEHEKIATVHMKESKRQSESIYKESADLMANKKTIEAFHKLTENNKIIEIVSKNERFDTIATEYCNSHKDTILVTARNADREALNSGIRLKLQEQNKISKVDNDLTIRESKNLQPADKYFTQNYAIGDIVVCHSDLMGKAGTEIKITGINRKTNEIIGVNKSNVEFKVNVMKHGNELNIFKETTKQFAVGEKIVFLKNDKGLQVMNGQS
jgi:ATP-dependent exoDNAse (exonuclease V) alpha subunit